MNHQNFAEETVEKMKKTLKQTKDKELAFVLCKRDEKITHGRPTCVGNYRKVYYGESKCKPNEKAIGSFHTHITNNPASIEDLVATYDQDIMCVGSKSMIPFYDNVVCYSAIDKRKKDYAEKIFEDYKKLRDILSAKIKNKEITIPEANSIKDNKHSDAIKNLLPLFYKLKL